MNRRTYLSVVGVASSGVFTGCLSDTILGGEATEPSNVNVSFDSSRFVSNPKSRVNRTGMTGKLTAPTYLSAIEIQAQFRNDAGDILETASGYFQELKKDQTWNFYIPSLAAEPPADGDIVVAEATSGNPPSFSGAKVIDSSLHKSGDKSDQNDQILTARVKNTSGSKISYLNSYVKFLTDNGTALEGASESIDDLPAGETWYFKIEKRASLGDPRPKATDFSIVLNTM